MRKDYSQALLEFKKMFGQLPADFGYPVVKEWQGKVFYAQSKKALRAYKCAKTLFKATSRRYMMLYLFADILVSMVTGVYVSWPFAMFMFWVVIGLATAITVCLNHYAHKLESHYSDKIFWSDGKHFYKVLT